MTFALVDVFFCERTMVLEAVEVLDMLADGVEKLEFLSFEKEKLCPLQQQLCCTTDEKTPQ